MARMAENAVLERLIISLDKRSIPYEVWIEEEISPYPLSEVAEALGISEEAVVQVVLPAHWLIDMERMKEALQTRQVRLATAEELKKLFPESKPEAISPFGKGYDFPTYLDVALLEGEEIAFAVGNRRQMVKMKTRDFAGLIFPCLADFHRRPLCTASGI